MDKEEPFKKYPGKQRLNLSDKDKCGKDEIS